MIIQTSPQTSHASPSTHCEPLVAYIEREIALQGPMSFARFMEHALYAPDMGYYITGLPKLGAAGDFTTAPEISILYSQTIARQCQEILSHCRGDILELGAGTGNMAAEILLYLEREQCLPQRYYIFDISPALRLQQQAHIKARAPHLFSKVKWLKSLENLTLDGVIIANEVIDALPVHRFKYLNDQLLEYYVNSIEGVLACTLAAPSFELKNYVDTLDIEFVSGYESECHLSLSPWLSDLNHVLNKGVILLIDYGFPRHEYYHPDRSSGTLMCHYQHCAHTDPLSFIGRQDITAHVDFTRVAEIALSLEWEVRGYTNQASFLLSCGLIELLQQQPQENYMTLTQQIKILTSPNEMGELFKVMALSKGFTHSLIGFNLSNMIEKL